MKIVANLDLGTNTKAINVVDPTANQDMATKKYVDDVDASTGNPTITVLTSGTAATYTTPTGCKVLKVIAIGGGGGGGGADNDIGGGSGGGGGGSVIAWISSPAASYTYTIGTGGNGGGNAGGSGTSGNNTTFAISGGATIITATGGDGGAGNSGVPGFGSSGSVASPLTTSNSIIIAGGAGSRGYANSMRFSDPAIGGYGGKSFLGSENKVVTFYVSYDPAFVTSKSNTGSIAGENAGNYGCGGGGGAVSNTTNGAGGGDGSSGVIIIEEYY